MEEIYNVQNHPSLLIPYFPPTREPPSVKQQKFQILPVLREKRDRCTTDQLMGAWYGFVEVDNGPLICEHIHHTQIHYGRKVEEIREHTMSQSLVSNQDISVCLPNWGQTIINVSHLFCEYNQPSSFETICLVSYCTNHIHCWWIHISFPASLGVHIIWYCGICGCRWLGFSLDLDK